MSDKWTISEIRTCNRENGYHWFDRGTMRFFNSHVERSVYQGPGGVFFVSSERYGSGPMGSEPPRVFKVRRFNPKDCTVSTVDGLEGTSRARIMDAAKALARGR